MMLMHMTIGEKCLFKHGCHNFQLDSLTKLNKVGINDVDAHDA